MMISSRRNSNKGPRIVAHDHDVLCGRGVNIAQHTGNERFRSLVNTRHDESYCENFSTSEKKALALEIIEHIQSLQPPGRFLKRSGRQHSSRGLEGPWEELTSKEHIKKTCQALRDCNRNDRTGYGVSVTIPEDVKQQAEELSKCGLSLKEYAANKVAKTYNNNKTPSSKKKPPPTAETHAAVAPKSVVAKTPSKKTSLTEKGSGKRYATPTTGDNKSVAVSAATSHKRPRTEELKMIYSSHNIHPHNMSNSSSSAFASTAASTAPAAVQPSGPVLSASAATTTAAMYASTLDAATPIHSSSYAVQPPRPVLSASAATTTAAMYATNIDANTPIHSSSYAAAVPVTNTPGPMNHPFLHQPQHQPQHQTHHQPQHQQQHHHQMPDVDLMHSHGHFNHFATGPHPSQQPMMPPSPMNHQDLLSMAACANSVAAAAIPAPYSPVVWNHHGCEGYPTTTEEEEDDIEPVPMRDWKPPYQQNLFEDPLAPHALAHDDATEPEDVFRLVAANASANLGNNGEENFPPIMMSHDSIQESFL
jgi:hypothetical protein